MAEAAAVIGLVASIATLVELSGKVVSRLRDFTSKTAEVPESFRSLSSLLPLLTATTQRIRSQAEDSCLSNDVIKALKDVIDDTSKQLSEVQTSLSKVLPSDGASKIERALKTLKSLAKEEKIHQVLEKIHRNNESLILHQTTRHVDTGDRILEALSKLSVISPTLPCPSSNIPFGRDPDFVDRGALVDQLLDKCALPASRTALVGLGGVGKSQLAIELSYRVRERSPETWVLWVHAGSTARFEHSFRDIANYIDISGRQDPRANVFRLVHDWLRGIRSGQWLLILDNVDSSDILSEVGNAGQGGRETGADGERWQPVTAYLPQSQNGSILITSRSQEVASKLVEAKDIITVQPMALAQALALFEKKLGPLIRGDEATDLATVLEFIPLAIVQAAAYISQRAPRYSAGQYLEDFRKSDGKKRSLLKNEGGQLRRDWQANNSILVTWQISFEHVQRQRPSAANLLSLMSFFDRQGIPEALVQNRIDSRSDYGRREKPDEYNDKPEEESDEDNTSERSEDDSFEDDVQTLRNYSFVSVGADRTFEMHALVQLATRKWLEENRQLEVWKQLYIKNLSTEFPRGDYKNWTYCQALFPHAKSAMTQRPKEEKSLREWALLLYNAGCYAWMKGNIVEAIELSENAMTVRKKTLGQEHTETIESIRMVGLAYSLAGRWKEAEKLQEQVMETRQRVLGQEHPDTLISIANLASTYWDQGRWNEAEELEVQVMEAMKKVLGPEHPDTLTSITNLASTYRNQGRWKEAEELEVQVMETRQRVLGQEHPNTLTSIANLALTYRDQGRWKEAEELQVQVTETIKKVLGPEHPNTLTSISGLASTYRPQKRWKEAEELQVQLIETRQRVLGQEHPDTLISIANLASTYRAQKRWKEAEELQLQVLETRRRVLGQEHPSTLTSMNNLALTWKTLGRAGEATLLLENCVRLRKQVLGPEHPYTEASLKGLRKWKGARSNPT